MATIVFLILDDVAGMDACAWTSNAWIAKEANLTDRQVRRIFAELEEHGLVRRVPDKRNRREGIALFHRCSNATPAANPDADLEALADDIHGTKVFRRTRGRDEVVIPEHSIHPDGNVRVHPDGNVRLNDNRVPEESQNSKIQTLTSIISLGRVDRGRSPEENLLALDRLHEPLRSLPSIPHCDAGPEIDRIAHRLAEMFGGPVGPFRKIIWKVRDGIIPPTVIASAAKQTIDFDKTVVSPSKYFTRRVQRIMAELSKSTA